MFLKMTVKEEFGLLKFIKKGNKMFKVRIYTKENNYKSSRTVDISEDELRLIIEQDYLKCDEKLISLTVEEVRL